jgi:hypothetical protein
MEKSLAIGIMPRRRRRLSNNHNHNNNDNTKITNAIVVGVRLPQPDDDNKKDVTLQQTYETWLRNLQQQSSRRHEKKDHASTAVVVWELNQHEDEHDIILDLSFNYTLFCQPQVLILKVSSMHIMKWALVCHGLPSNESFC